MKNNFRYLYLLVALLLAMGSCTEEPVDIFEDSRIEDYGNYRKSIFNIPLLTSETKVINDSVRLIQVDGNYVNKFKSNITVAKGIAMTEISIDNNHNIPDGNYVVKFDSIADRYIVKVNSERIAVSEINNGNYKELSATTRGTVDKPYLIRTRNDFGKFIKALGEDTYHGAGLHFVQVNDIEWMNDEANDGEGLASQSFAGEYNGNGTTLSDVTINGKSDCGLFKSLTNGAVIKDLTISNMSFSNGSTMGAIAGMSEYTVSISGVKVMGEISGNENVGGLIGSGKGNITISNVTMGASVTGKKNVGGIVGYVHDNGNVSVDGYAVTSSFRVGSESASTSNDAKNVGGMIGCVNNSTFNVSNSQVMHTSSKEDEAIVIAAKECAGGIVGVIESLSAASCITFTKVITPIKVNNYGGGFVGKAEIDNKLTITDCQSCIITKQGNYIGGFIGSIQYTTDNLLVYKNNHVVASNNSDVYIAGSDYVGGLFGKVKAKSLSLEGDNYIMTNIEGGTYVGGIVGCLEDTKLLINQPKYGKENTEIIGLDIAGTSKVGGLVGYMKNSTLEGKQSLSPTLKIKTFNDNEASVICKITGKGQAIGGAVGEAFQSEILDIAVKSTIKNEANIYTGGIVGYFNDGKTAVKSCSFKGDIVGSNYTGGIVGEINKLGQITQCINYGTVKGGDITGGIVGKILNLDDEPWVNECVNVGTVTGVNFVGGIAGYISADGNEANDWTKIAKCGNYGAVTASSSEGGCVGGIVGKCDSDKIRVNHCANHGTIRGNGTFKGIGGIAGSLGKDGVLTEWDNVDVYNCANTGAVESDRLGEANMGGIVGYMEEGDEGAGDTNSEVHLCYNCGNVGPAKSATHGGMIGHCDYYTSLRYCINYGNTMPDGEAMIGTVVSAGIVHDKALYHLEGTGDDEGRNWSSTKFTKAEMDSLGTFTDFKDAVESEWCVGIQLNMKGTNENTVKRVILSNCPFQNIVYP